MKTNSNHILFSFTLLLHSNLQLFVKTLFVVVTSEGADVGEGGATGSCPCSAIVAAPCRGKNAAQSDEKVMFYCSEEKFDVLTHQVDQRPAEMTESSSSERTPQIFSRWFINSPQTHAEWYKIHPGPSPGLCLQDGAGLKVSARGPPSERSTCVCFRISRSSSALELCCKPVTQLTWNLEGFTSWSTSWSRGMLNVCRRVSHAHQALLTLS